MEETVIKYRTKKPRLKNPIFIEGLSGVGDVGRLAAEYLIRKLHGKKLADVYSQFFAMPPLLIPGVKYEQGVAELLKDELFYDEKSNLIILTGYYQGYRPENYYKYADTLLDLCAEFSVSRIFTLGGYTTGRYLKNPGVYVIATSDELVEEMRRYGLKVGSSGNVFGITGVLLGLGKERGFEVICLLGETHGAYPDPKGAKVVLEKLVEIIGIELDLKEIKAESDKLDEEFERYMAERLKTERKKEEFSYIG
ncbi:PAC2 family protein [Candidatus Alkanophaga liquidiphilum]|nr:Proteasome assembly chaperonefamily protein [Candidatus Alkanophaga liquidiphilum]